MATACGAICSRGSLLFGRLFVAADFGGRQKYFCKFVDLRWQKAL